MERLREKVALITGGTSGIGAACARLFSDEGALVIVVGRDEEKAKKFLNDYIVDGRILFVKCDVTSEGEIASLKKAIIDRYGHLDVLVNCAGLYITNPLEKITEEEWGGCVQNQCQSRHVYGKAFSSSLS